MWISIRYARLPFISISLDLWFVGQCNNNYRIVSRCGRYFVRKNSDMRTTNLGELLYDFDGIDE